MPEQDMHDSWEALNNAREPPRTVPTSPSLPSALLAPLPGPWAPEEQPEPLQRGAGVRLGHGKSPSVPAWLCPAVTCRVSQRKEGCPGRGQGYLGWLCLPVPNSTAVHVLGKGHGCSEVVQNWHRGFGMEDFPVEDFPVEVFSRFRGFSCTGSGISHVHTPGADGSKRDTELLLQTEKCLWDSAGLSSPVRGREEIGRENGWFGSKLQLSPPLSLSLGAPGCGTSLFPTKLHLHRAHHSQGRKSLQSIKEDAGCAFTGSEQRGKQTLKEGTGEGQAAGCFR